MELYQALMDRRSIRKYRPDPVPPQTLKKLLEAARQAPSWKNQQCWKFIVVRDDKKKEQLADSLAEGNPAYKAIRQAPVVVMVCADPDASGKEDGKEYYLLDAGLAMHQFMLAAQAEGVGTCWVAWFTEEKARRACNIPEKYRVVGLTPIGVPEKQPAPRGRKELSEIVYEEEWGRSYAG